MTVAGGKVAEYVSMAENVLARKSASMAFTDAAALASAAVIIPELHDEGQVRPGQEKEDEE